ncbi:MAG: chemotaxis protein CheD [bacterium]|nr:chemotaxis protein CheD [bacterium]
MVEESTIIKVKIADYKITGKPNILVTNGLGSCVGLSLYDEKLGIGGLAHIMLPQSKNDVEPKFFPRYADTAINAILAELKEQGSNQVDIVAKIAGGASMFPDLKKDGKGVGERNVECAMGILASIKIPLIGSDTGGDYGRSVEFSTMSGEMRIRSIRHGIIII